MTFVNEKLQVVVGTVVLFIGVQMLKLGRFVAGLASVIMLAMATAAPAASIDWPTYGFDITRAGYNNAETALSPANAGALKQHWAVRIDGGAITGQVIVASAIPTTAGTTDLAFVATERGTLAAIDTKIGKKVWSHNTGFTTPGCQDLPHGEFGISSSAVFDRKTGAVYAMGGDGKLYAYDAATGNTITGWPVTILPDASVEHVYGALTLFHDSVYVTTASMCDHNTYHGRVVRVSTGTTPAITAAIYPDGTKVHPDGSVIHYGSGGGGVWGAAGLSVDALRHRLYIATGNLIGSTNEFDHLGDQVVELTPDLGVIASNYPGLPCANCDSDFGSAPVLFQGAPMCAPLLAVINKDQLWFTYDRFEIGAGPTASLANNSYVGEVAFDPKLRRIYVTNLDRVEAWAQDPKSCSVKKVWSVATTSGPNGQLGQSISPPTAANGVLYYGNGAGETLTAFDGKTGATLASFKLSGSVFAAPTVVNGLVLAPAWDGKLYAFGM